MSVTRSLGPDIVPTERARVIAHAVRRGELAAAEVIERALARIDELDPVLHAFITVVGDRARLQDSQHREMGTLNRNG